MAYTVTIHRSPDGVNWTTIHTWVTNGGAVFIDFLTDSPGAGTWHYEMRIVSDTNTDIAGPRRLAVLAGNR